MEALPILAAGREVPDAIDRIRRYCGLAWSGGPPEIWAWPYYDTVQSDDPDRVTPVDVLCAGVLHPGLSRSDLVFFMESEPTIGAWLAMVPSGCRLWQLSDDQMEHLESLPEALSGASVALVSKVLHRKRPDVIPLIDRHVIDWYRPVTGKRAAAEAWAPLVRSMREDQADEAWRLAIALAGLDLEAELWPDLDLDDRPHLSWLRAVDIAIWMGTR